MSDMSATVSVTPQGFAVAGYEKLNYDFKFIDNVFDPAKGDLADCYTKWGRVLAVMDENMKSIYGSAQRLKDSSFVTAIGFYFHGLWFQNSLFSVDSIICDHRPRA